MTHDALGATLVIGIIVCMCVSICASLALWRSSQALRRQTATIINTITAAPGLRFDADTKVIDVKKFREALERENTRNGGTWGL